VANVLVGSRADLRNVGEMTLPNVPPHTELFNIAVGTRDACRLFLGTNAESAISPLAIAAFQLQAAHVGARIAAMATEAAYGEMLRAIVTDSEGGFSVSLNLSARCSATVVDLCAAALGRLLGRSGLPSREMDAAEIANSLKKAPAPAPLAPLVDPFVVRLGSTDWDSIVTLRHAVTHKVYKRGVYGSTRQAPEPAPLAWPQQNDVEWGGRMVAMDAAAGAMVSFADDTFREFCGNLARLAPAS